MRPRLLRRIAVLLPIAASLAVAAAANLWAVAHPARLDLTSAGVYSIGEETRRVLAGIAEPVRVTFFYDARSKAMLDAKALLDQYAAASPLVGVRAVDPLLQPAEALRHQVRFAGTTVIEAGGRRVTVNGGTEADFTNGLIRATRGAARRICFTDGHVEADPFSLKTHDHFEGDMSHGHSHSSGGRVLEVHERHGMGMARDALETLGYEVAKVLLVKGPGQLAGCAVAIVASPQATFRPEEAAQLTEWVLAGGKAILMLEPFVDAGLDGLLAAFGIRDDRTLVVDEASHYWTDPATPAVSTYLRHRITRNLALTFFPGVSSLSPLPERPRDTSLAPLVQTGAGSTVLDPRTGAPADGERAARTVMVLATKRLGEERDAELAVFGDGDFATNSFFAILGNGALFLNTVSALAEAERLIDITPRGYEMPSVRLTNEQMRFTFAVSTIVLPATISGLGLLLWWRRR